MVEMSVGEKYVIYRCRIERKVRPISFLDLMPSLKQTAVEQDFQAVCFDKMTRSRDCLRCPAKCNLHYTHPFVSVPTPTSITHRILVYAIVIRVASQPSGLLISPRSHRLIV